LYLSARIAVVVPAYNVAARLRPVLTTMPAFVDHVIVVDDASVDGTHLVAAEAGDARVVLVRHPVNRGVGGALASGYRRALELGADVIAVMAGDGQMDPDDLAGVLAPVANGTVDYAKGNRLRHPDVVRAMPWTRLAGNLVLSTLTRAATGLWHVGDSQCGYTAIHRRVLTTLDPAEMWARYGYPNHLLGALARAGFRVVDVVVRPIYAGERSGVRLRDAVVTIPRILGRIALARVLERRRALPDSAGFVKI
jgi:glycosyltransferase involved in cell wall biosynthesis